MKLKTALLYAALILSATRAVASPVEFSFSDDQLNTGPITYGSSFTLAQGALFTGTVTTTSSEPNNVTIDSLLLSNGISQYLFNVQPDGSDLSFTSTSSGVSMTTIKGFSIYNYTLSYSFDPVFLSAGDWTFTLVGNENSNKQGGALALDLIDPPANVPEPASLALAAVALGALYIARRRNGLRASSSLNTAGYTS